MAGDGNSRVCGGSAHHVRTPDGLLGAGDEGLESSLE